MIWVEILSRHRDIAARFRIAAPEARIGRGYDNDVIIDDPYVAAQHLRVFRDEAGQLVAEDLGSATARFSTAAAIGSRASSLTANIRFVSAKPICAFAISTMRSNANAWPRRSGGPCRSRRPQRSALRCWD